MATRIKSIRTAYRKTELLTDMADRSGLTRKEAHACLDALYEIIEGHLKKNGAGEFSLPGLLKCKIKQKPARAARKARNPFTGETIKVKAKPAYNVVQIKPLKGLKDMIA